MFTLFNHSNRSRISAITLILGILITIPTTTEGMPVHPNLRDNPQASASEAAVSSSFDRSKPEGMCSPDDFFSSYLQQRRNLASTSASLAPPPSQYKILALLVDFSDKVSSTQATFFDSLVFDSVGNTIRDYFSKISSVQLDIVTVNLPSSVGWSRAPQTYAYYVDGQRGIYGTYPNNSQGLVNDLVNLVDPSVDFSQYDNDGDGYVDVLLVIHAGSGAELTNNDNDIHSHKWSLPAPVSKDGILVYNYTVQPEYWYAAGDMTIGVYSHELCHGFGLPDLYDTDYTSNAIGDWGIMSFGSWNGPSNLGGSPAFPSAWSRIKMGLETPIDVTANQNGVVILPAESGGSIYKLPTIGGLSNEYYLVENRQQTGYDTYLPSKGLLIWHIDDNKTGNTQEWYPGQNAASHYKVALEQADGLWTIEKSTLSGNSGDAGDPFPGTSNRISFNVGTTPASDTYTAGSTLTAVNSITPSGANIIVDFVVSALAGVEPPNGSNLPNDIKLSQNYPNPFNPSTVIEFSLARGAEVSLEVFNILGQQVDRIYEGYAGPGTTQLTWDANDKDGQPVASGIYLYRLAIDGGVESKKMMLLR